MHSPVEPQGEWSAVVQSRHLKIWANPDRDYRHECASNESAELGLLMLLVSDRDMAVRLAAVENLRQTPSSLLQLCGHSDETVRAAVVRHPGADAEVLRRLTYDPDYAIASAARARLMEVRLLEGSRQERPSWDPESTATMLLGPRPVAAKRNERPAETYDQDPLDLQMEDADLLVERRPTALHSDKHIAEPSRDATVERPIVDLDSVSATDPTSTTDIAAEIGPDVLSILLSETEEGTPDEEQDQVVLDVVPSPARRAVPSISSEEPGENGSDLEPPLAGADPTDELLLGGLMAAPPVPPTSVEPEAVVASDDLAWHWSLQAEVASLAEADATTEGLSTYDRARLLATDLCAWRPEWIVGFNDLVEALDLPVVGPTHNAIRQQMDDGMTPDELPVVLGLREFWRESAGYGMAWRHYRAGWTSYNERASLPWPLALRLVRSFVGVPEVEEIELFLAEQFDCWRMMPAYVNSYSFSDYLYSLTNTDGTALEWRFRTR